MKHGDYFLKTTYGGPVYSYHDSKDLVCLRFRIDPVPYSGRRWHGGSYYRHPKTTQERRWAVAHSEYIRGRRSKMNLPDAWDDYCRSDCSNKSWKAAKCSKQWMKNLKRENWVHGEIPEDSDSL